MPRPRSSSPMLAATPERLTWLDNPTPQRDALSALAQYSCQRADISRNRAATAGLPSPPLLHIQQPHPEPHAPRPLLTRAMWRRKGPGARLALAVRDGASKRCSNDVIQTKEHPTHARAQRKTGTQQAVCPHCCNERQLAACRLGSPMRASMRKERVPGHQGYRQTHANSCLHHSKSVDSPTQIESAVAMMACCAICVAYCQCIPRQEAIALSIPTRNGTKTKLSATLPTSPVSEQHDVRRMLTRFSNTGISYHPHYGCQAIPQRAYFPIPLPPHLVNQLPSPRLKHRQPIPRDGRCTPSLQHSVATRRSPP